MGSERGCLMKRYRGNEKVEPGIYLNVERLAFRSMAEEGRLPGTARDEYRRVPTLALLVVGPFLGGAYVIFLPFIGFGMLAWVGGTKLVHVTAEAGTAFIRVLRPVWQPAMAFLSRGKTAKAGRTDPDHWVEGVKKELEAKNEETTK